MTQQLTREQILATIVPKSDQFNYDDLIGGPITVTVAGVSAGAPDQPVNIRLQGETRFYRPCKTMRRVLIMLWGDDGHKWIGRSMTLYGEPNVMFGGVKVGGIRISHMSDISETMMLQLTMTRGKKAPYKVMPLRAADVLSIGADRARDVTPQEPPKEVDPLMLVAPGAAMEKEIEAEMKEHPPHEHDEQDPAADDSPSSGADSRGTNDGVPPPVAPGASIDDAAILKLAERQADMGYTQLEKYAQSVTEGAKKVLRANWAKLKERAVKADLTELGA